MATSVVKYIGLIFLVMETDKLYKKGHKAVKFIGVHECSDDAFIFKYKKEYPEYSLRILGSVGKTQLDRSTRGMIEREFPDVIRDYKLKVILDAI